MGFCTYIFHAHLPEEPELTRSTIRVKFGNCSKKIETMGLVQKSLDRVCARNNLTSLSIEYQPMGMRGQYLDLKVFPLTRLSIGDAQHHNMDVLSKAVAACPFLDTLCIFWNTTIPNFNVWELFMHVPTETTLPLRELRLKGFYSSALPPLEYMRHLRGLERLSFLGKRWLNLLDDLFERFIEYRIFPAELCLEQVSTALLRYLKHDNHPGLRVLDISEERCTRFSSRFGMPLVTGSQEMNLVREAIKDHFDTHPPRERMRLVLKYCSIVN